jgi:hypothetical protein
MNANLASLVTETLSEVAEAIMTLYWQFVALVVIGAALVFLVPFGIFMILWLCGIVAVVGGNFCASKMSGN